MIKEQTVLVVGSDSLIGSTLIRHRLKNNERVIGTTRRKNKLNKNHVFLDMSQDLSTFSCPKAITSVVVCAAITKISECRANSKYATEINVQRTIELIKKFVDKGIFVVYLSTNGVFNGKIPFTNSNMSFSPQNEYGLHKVRVEEEISKFKESISIIRLTKVLGLNLPIFVDWLNSLRNNKTIYPFSDMFFAPIPVSFVAKAINRVVKEKLSGILQISNSRDVSYAQVAYWIAEQFGFNKQLVNPIKAAKTGFLEHIPQHTTLNIDRLTKELGMHPPDVKKIIEGLFR